MSPIVDSAEKSLPAEDDEATMMAAHGDRRHVADEEAPDTGSENQPVAYELVDQLFFRGLTASHQPAGGQRDEEAAHAAESSSMRCDPGGPVRARSCYWWGHEVRHRAPGSTEGEALHRHRVRAEIRQLLQTAWPLACAASSRVLSVK